MSRFPAKYDLFAFFIICKSTKASPRYIKSVQSFCCSSLLIANSFLEPFRLTLLDEERISSKSTGACCAALRADAMGDAVARIIGYPIAPSFSKILMTSRLKSNAQSLIVGCVDNQVFSLSLLNNRLWRNLVTLFFTPWILMYLLSSKLDVEPFIKVPSKSTNTSFTL